MAENIMTYAPADALIAPLQGLFTRLRDERGILIDSAALSAAYEGWGGNLYILNVSLSDRQIVGDKSEYVIRAMHHYLTPGQRQGLAGVRVFNCQAEFDQFISEGYLPVYEEPDEEIQLDDRSRLSPRVFAVTAT